MGKKKASKARQLVPQITQAFVEGKVYIREKPKSFYRTEWNKAHRNAVVYEVCLGQDSTFHDYTEEFFMPLELYIYKDGKVSWDFIYREHGLDRRNDKWFTDKLSEYIVMHKMGAYQSEHKAVSYSAGLTRTLAFEKKLDAARKKKERQKQAKGII